jgi:4-hydroxybenzoate polyprenyltransferase
LVGNGATAASPPPVKIKTLPLCVDLDGTLLSNDTLHDAALAVVLADWRVLLCLPGWLATGKAHFKQEIAARWVFDPATLPYNTDVLGLLVRERAGGRHIVLCTAADRRVAEVVAGHLGLFDEVMASDGVVNLRGPTKAEALVHHFGQRGFTYIGNDMTDLAVWERAATAVVVGASKRVQRKLTRLKVEESIPRRTSIGSDLLRALRPYQWSKNALCLVPLLASGSLDPTAWFAAMEAVVAFCATASAIYVLNDFSDLAADRAHPRKSRRPFASGALSLPWGLALALTLLAVGALLGWVSGALPVLVAYAGLSLAYTLRLKELPLVDVFVLAALYTLRVVAGGAASGHLVSLWLLGFSAFLFLSLGLIKRVSELSRLAAAEQTRAARRGYVVQDLGLLQQLGCASTFASAVVLSLYVQSDAALQAYGFPKALWASVPLLLFWQCRLWLATARGHMHDDPIVFATRDRVSWLTIASLCTVMLAARMLPGG